MVGAEGSDRWWIRAAAAGSIVLIGFVATMAASMAAPPVPPSQPQAQAPYPAQIDRNGVLILIRTTLIALQEANETGNYTVLRDLAAPAFQQANTAARLGEIFANLRAQKIDLAGVTVLDPQLTLLPQIEGNGLMHMAGFFPSVPTQINFELAFAPVNGRWRPFGISVQLGSSSPVAPTPPVASEVAPPIAKTPGKKTEQIATHRRQNLAKPAVEPKPGVEPQ